MIRKGFTVFGIVLVLALGSMGMAKSLTTSDSLGGSKISDGFIFHR